MSRRLSHVAGFDDAPFARDHRGDVLVVGTVYSGLRLECVLSGRVRRDGVNSTGTLIELVTRSRHKAHLQLVMLQGIAFAGFNVIDLQRLHAALGVPVMTVVRKAPDMKAIKRALLHKVGGGKRKWRLIEQAGTVERVHNVYVQRVGLSPSQAHDVIERYAVNSALPEPLRVAHLIAGGMVLGESRHRP
jgi:endonuclease V-like protein UPF0215 family